MAFNSSVIRSFQGPHTCAEHCSPGATQYCLQLPQPTMVLSCFGKLCAKEASKQPKKRYNEYVPAVFPTEAQDWRSPIAASTTRNISTVQDYVGENIQRAPKVSRRLWRRIVADHSKDAALGQVKVSIIVIMSATKKVCCTLENRVEVVQAFLCWCRWGCTAT